MAEKLFFIFYFERLSQGRCETPLAFLCATQQCNNATTLQRYNVSLSHDERTNDPITEDTGEVAREG
ncbi:MAG: hypothetical protein IKP84_10305, partial [Prevotella sp.]|nr:hypothetical protein [Prevotella sp.]